MKQFDPSMLFHISAIDEYRKLCYDKKDGAVIVNIGGQSIISQKYCPAYLQIYIGGMRNEILSQMWSTV